MAIRFRITNANPTTPSSVRLSVPGSGTGADAAATVIEEEALSTGALVRKSLNPPEVVANDTKGLKLKGPKGMSGSNLNSIINVSVAEFPKTKATSSNTELAVLKVDE